MVDPSGVAVVTSPGVIDTLVAPLVDQLKVVLEPESMVTGVPVKALITGFDPPLVKLGALHPATPAMQTSRISKMRRAEWEG